MSASSALRAACSALVTEDVVDGLGVEDALGPAVQLLEARAAQPLADLRRELTELQTQLLRQEIGFALRSAFGLARAEVLAGELTSVLVTSRLHERLQRLARGLAQPRPYQVHVE